MVSLLISMLVSGRRISSLLRRLVSGAGISGTVGCLRNKASLRASLLRRYIITARHAVRRILCVQRGGVRLIWLNRLRVLLAVSLVYTGIELNLRSCISFLNLAGRSRVTRRCSRPVCIISVSARNLRSLRGWISLAHSGLLELCIGILGVRLSVSLHPLGMISILAHSVPFPPFPA